MVECPGFVGEASSRRLSDVVVDLQGCLNRPESIVNPEIIGGLSRLDIVVQLSHKLCVLKPEVVRRRKSCNIVS